MHKLLISIPPWTPTVVTHSGLSAGQRAAPADRTGSGAASGPITQPDLSRQAESDTAAGRDFGSVPVRAGEAAGRTAAGAGPPLQLTMPGGRKPSPNPFQLPPPRVTMQPPGEVAPLVPPRVNGTDPTRDPRLPAPSESVPPDWSRPGARTEPDAWFKSDLERSPLVYRLPEGPRKLVLDWAKDVKFHPPDSPDRLPPWEGKDPERDPLPGQFLHQLPPFHF